MKKTYITENDMQTRELGKNLAKEFSSGAILALHGDLGSGKTTFTQGLAEGLGVKRHITSPTFLIQKSYSLPGEKMLYHLDLYRLLNEKDGDSIGIKDLLHQPGQVVVIEWPEKIESLLPSNIYHLYFTYLDDMKREIVIKKYDE